MKKKIDEKAIEAIVDRKIKQSVGVYTSKLQKERQRVLDYFNETLPKQQHAAGSSYVDSTVYNAIEFMKAALLEGMSGGSEIVKFSPQNMEDVRPAAIATAYTSFVFFRQHDALSIMNDVIEDGLKARIGVVKIYWETVKSIREETFEDLDPLTFEGLSAQPDVEIVDTEIDPFSGFVSGSLNRISDRSQPRVITVPPEEFGIEARASKLEGSFHFQRTMLTKGEIKKLGYDQSKLKDLNSGDSDPYLDIEIQSRFSQIDNGPISDEGEGAEPKYWFYEAYLPMTDEDGDACLYKVARVGDVTLSIEEVDRSPFKVFVPIREAHSFWGSNFGARLCKFQGAKTVLTRSILDNAAISSNPRWMVATGTLTNPRELLDQRGLGGIVNVTRPDAIAPLPVPQPNQFVFPTIGVLDTEVENSTGISRLMQGLDKNAISKQNSAQMMVDQIDVGQTRMRTIARTFGQFLKDVFIELHRLVIENESRPRVFEVAGDWIELSDWTSWIERRDAEVSLTLSPGDAQAEAMKFAGMIERAAADPLLSRSLGDNGRYAAAKHMASLMGIKNFTEFFTPPERMQPEGPDPMAMKQMEIQERMVAAQELAAQAQKIKVESEAQIKGMKLQMEAMQNEFSNMIKQLETDRKAAETASRIDLAQREQALNESAPIESVKGISSPGL